ncbi:MAG TPA: MFS transporter [Burkholderiales bacterium]|nr:MFS transporter [Burkholderiales bacterium]
MSISQPPAGAADVPRSTVVGVVAAATVAQVASVMGISVFPVIALPLAADMGVEPSLIGYQMSIVYGAATFSAPWLSTGVNRWGACRATQVGLAFCVLGCLLAFTSNIAALVVASVLLGCSVTMMTPTSAHLLMRFTPPRNRVFLFSLKQTGVPLAWALMALIAPPITQAYGWRWSLLVVVLVAGGTAVALQPVRARWDDDRHTLRAKRASAMEGLKVLWERPTLRWLVMSAFCLAFVQLCLGTFLVTMLVKEAGYSLVAAGLMLSVTQLAGVTGRIVCGWIADRTGNSLQLLRVLSLVGTFCCPVVALVTPAWPMPVVVLFFFLFGASSVGWNGLYVAEIARRSPPGRASTTTGGASVWNFGGILAGPAVFATVYRGVGSYAFTYVLLSLVGLAGSALIMMAISAARREAAERPQP